MAPVGRVLQSDRPDYQPVELTRPELYFSPTLSGYAIARTAQGERACAGGETTDYVGTKGVKMSSFVRRAAFALAFLDYNVLGSGAINSDSEMLWVRNIKDRLEKLAPFLAYDGDPYPVDDRRAGLLGRRRLHADEPVPVRPAHRQRRPADDRQRPRPRRQLRPQQRQGRRRRLRRVGDVLRARRGGPDHQGVGGRLRQPVHAAATRCRRRCATTCATRRTCSACRPTSTPSTSSTRSSSSSARGRGRSPRRRASTRASRPRRPSPSPTTPDRPAGPADLASESSTARFTPYYTMFADPSGVGEDFVILRRSCRSPRPTSAPSCRRT